MTKKSEDKSVQDKDHSNNGGHKFLIYSMGRICLTGETEEEKHITPVRQPQNFQYHVVIPVSSDESAVKPLVVTKQRLPSAKQTKWTSEATMDEIDRKPCFICGDELTDPRILPCWHAGCFTCILGMTQSDVVGRAVRCRKCQATVLFDNIRSLPEPIHCSVCGHPTTDPVMFPCCTRIFCLQCVWRTRLEGGLVCGNRCVPEARYAIRDLTQARLCPLCFALHKEPAQECSHYLCRQCSSSTLGQSRRCKVCESAAGLAPEPIDPFSENAGNIFSSNIPLTQIPNNQVNLGYPQQLMRRLTENEGYKVICTLIVFAVSLLIFGFCFTTWAVVTLTMVILRFSLFLSISVTSLITVIIKCLSLYYFYHALIFYLVSIILHFTLGRFHKVGSAFVYLFIALVFIVPYYESIFLHILMVDFTLGVLIGVLEGRQRGAAL